MTIECEQYEKLIVEHARLREAAIEAMRLLVEFGDTYHALPLFMLREKARASADRLRDALRGDD